MKRKIFLSFFTIIFSFSALSAKSLRDTVRQSYLFGVDSLDKELVIDVPSDCQQLYLNVKGGLDEGKCKVIFKNVEGVWQKNLQLGYYGTNNSLSIGSAGMKCGTVNGDEFLKRNKEIRAVEMKKMYNSSRKINGIIIYTVHRPDEGKWKVVMIPENAEAEIEVEYSIQ